MNKFLLLGIKTPEIKELSKEFMKEKRTVYFRCISLNIEKDGS